MLALEVDLVVSNQAASGYLRERTSRRMLRNGTIHDELGHLVDASLTPMQALETATRNPAEFIGKLHSIGTIELNKNADLVLLDANPLVDTHNAARIAAVILRGQIVWRKAQGRP